MKPYEQIMKDKDIGMAFDYLIQRSKTVREYNVLNMLNEEWDLREYGQIVEQKHGEWLVAYTDAIGQQRLECSLCGFETWNDDYAYCPNCGSNNEVTE